LIRFVGILAITQQRRQKQQQPRRAPQPWKSAFELLKHEPPQLLPCLQVTVWCIVAADYQRKLGSKILQPALIVIFEASRFNNMAAAAVIPGAVGASAADQSEVTGYLYL
jgi:hypothetical protein